MMLYEAQYATAQRRIRSSIAALTRTIAAMEGIRGRKTLFVLSEGFIRAPRLERLYADLIERARRAIVRIYFINPQGLLGVSVESEGAGLTHLAHETGGRALLSNDIRGPVRQVLAESANYYLIGFVSASVRPGEHHVHVHVRRDGVRLSGRTRYYITERGRAEARDLDALESISDTAELGLRMSTEVEGPVTQPQVVLSIEVEDTPAAAGSVKRPFRVRFVGRRASDGKTVAGATDVSVDIAAGLGRVVTRLTLAPGLWQVRVVLMDLVSGALGSVTSTVRTPGL
jgi:hypothetical protein